MSIETLKNQLADYAKDIKLNISTVLTEEGAPDLNLVQIYGVALASAYATKNSVVITALLNEAANPLTESEITAAKTAALMMAMNNVYYRFTHLISDKTFSTLPAKLRMNAIANPGISKIDFELSSLAVSALNGCGMCIDAHTQTLIKAGVSKLAIQSAVRIAAVINAAAVGVEI
jgi:alkyl hydroperoxide reductase subunit D